MPEEELTPLTGNARAGSGSGNGNGTATPPSLQSQRVSPWGGVGKRVAVENISKSFGGVAALNDVSLTAVPGR